jgi:hypothetical protein
MATPEPEANPTPALEFPDRHEGESEADYYQRVNNEWMAQGHSAEDIGNRIRQMVDEAESPEEAEPDEPIPADEPEDALEPQAPPGMVACPVCKGGGAIPEQFAPARDKEVCSECHGWGEVATGSLKPDYAVLPCTSCQGNGYTARVDQRQWEQPQQEPPARQW